MQAQSMLFLVVLSLLLVGQSETKKVLIVACPAISHMREMNYVGEELMKMGHEVYQIVNSKFDRVDKVTSSGIKPIFYAMPDGAMTEEELRIEMTKTTTVIESLKLVIRAMYDECRYVMEDKEFLEKVRAIGFDLMVVDAFPPAPCRFILPYHLGVPYVAQSSVLGDWLVRLPVLPSFHPAMDLTETFFLSDKMNFWQRVVNVLLYGINTLIARPMLFNIDTSLLEEYAPGLGWQDLVLKSELFLVTRDHMLEYPTVELPNVISSSGSTVQPAKPLPADIQSIYEGAKHGVVLVSFGSLANALPEETVNKLFDAFSRLKQTVIMRFVGDVEAARRQAPANVHLVSWIPQNDMLGHEKTLAFVTHCGNNGQYESLYHGVPMVGIPIFAEQPFNAFRVVQHGYGLQVKSMDSFSADELFGVLSEVITDPKYRSNTKKASAIMKADRMRPNEKLAYWVDHVMKFGGAHLRSSCQDLPLYKLFMLDVLGFLFLILLCFVYVMKKLVSIGCRKKASKPKAE